MNKCIFHGPYIGSECLQCKVNRLDQKFEKNSSFPIFILKSTLIMLLGMAIGWYLWAL